MATEVEKVPMIFKIMRMTKHSQTLLFELPHKTILIQDF